MKRECIPCVVAWIIVMPMLLVGALALCGLFVEMFR
jgi:hypothetical protein